jgi:hypothetical protein
MTAIKTQWVCVNGTLRECKVSTAPFPEGTKVLIDGLWWSVACVPCEVTEIMIDDPQQHCKLQGPH